MDRFLDFAARKRLIKQLDDRLGECRRERHASASTASLIGTMKIRLQENSIGYERYDCMDTAKFELSACDSCTPVVGVLAYTHIFRTSHHERHERHK